MGEGLPKGRDHPQENLLPFSFPPSPRLGLPLSTTPKGAGQHHEAGTGEKADASLPFHVNVTHLLPRDAEVIQDHVLCVPDNTTQEKPVEEKGSTPRGFPSKGWAILD